MAAAADRLAGEHAGQHPRQRVGQPAALDHPRPLGGAERREQGEAEHPRERRGQERGGAPFGSHAYRMPDRRRDRGARSGKAPPVVASALIALRDELAVAPLALETPLAPEGRRVRDELADQIDDYLLPRLRQMDAPLLMVVGGSTGAGKSTLVNSLVGAPVSAAGVLRPTTRAPVLVCNPADVHWFDDDRILPELARTTGGPAGPGGLELAPTDALPPGLALLDAPDIDSVVEANRALAGQLLAAADSWLFVTTAARYADAVPWDMLQAARDRGTAVSLVLNRVPADAREEVPGHLRQMVAERGLGETELLVVAESELADGLLPAAALAPVRGWLDALAADAEARGELVRRTLAGALDSVPPRVGIVEAALAEQAAAADELRDGAARAYENACEEVDETVRSGSLLRGEVLARWHEVDRDGRLHARAREPGRVAARSRALARDRRAAARRRAQERGRQRRGRRRGGGGRPRRRARRRDVARPSRRGGRCSRGRPGWTRCRASCTSAPRRRCGRGRGTSSSSSARRAPASARPRGSRRSASTARG